MTIYAFISALRAAFVAELEATGAYNKQGMQLAFERAMTAALTQLANAGGLR